MAEKNRVHVVISGRVQGVFFRMETKDAAQDIGGLTGWVRNKRNGTVEAVFEGEADRIDKILKWCEKGSRMSKVTNVSVDREEYSGDYLDFRVTY